MQSSMHAGGCESDEAAEEIQQTRTYRSGHDDPRILGTRWNTNGRKAQQLHCQQQEMAAKNISAPNTRGKNGKKKRRPREPEPLEEGSAVHWAVMRVMQRAVPVADVDVPEAADAVVAEAADAAGFAAVPEAVDSAADVALVDWRIWPMQTMTQIPQTGAAAAACC
ncbi:unnamed protein product [Effrenium voratum]|nr:unnamed protein product [Effrenium voratum]